MNNRLQQFLELENLSPARLADILGVQRSGLSHILSGRNKPGYDFIFKLLTKFPAISADWLLTGKGKPYKEMNGSYYIPSTDGSPRSAQQKIPGGFAVRNQDTVSAETLPPIRPDQPGNAANSGTHTKKLQERTYTEQQYAEQLYSKQLYSDQSYNTIQNNPIQYDYISYNTEPFQEQPLQIEHFSGESGENVQYDLRQYPNIQNNEVRTPGLWEQEPEPSVEEAELKNLREPEEKHKDTNNQIDKSFFTQKQRPENSINGANCPPLHEKREIKRVIVFYNDGSFEELFPAAAKSFDKSK